MNIDELERKYAEVARSSASAQDFYLHVTREGVSKFYAFVLLRDLFQLGLQECYDIAKRVETGEGK